MTELSASSPAVRIERFFDGPIELVWKMWTTPEHFREWYGPPGASIVEAKMDLRVGGDRLVGMEVQTPNGTKTMWFAGEHLEILEHRRLVYTEAMADEAGAILSPAEMGMPLDHQAVTEVIKLVVAARRPCQIPPVQEQIAQPKPEELRYEYRLTAKGRDAFPILAAMAAWGDRWLTGPEGTPLVLHHTSCDHDMQARVVCGECAQPIDVHDIRATLGPGHPDA